MLNRLSSQPFNTSNFTKENIDGITRHKVTINKYMDYMGHEKKINPYDWLIAKRNSGMSWICTPEFRNNLNNHHLGSEQS